MSGSVHLESCFQPSPPGHHSIGRSPNSCSYLLWCPFPFVLCLFIFSLKSSPMYLLSDLSGRCSLGSVSPVFTLIQATNISQLDHCNNLQLVHGNLLQPPSSILRQQPEWVSTHNVNDGIPFLTFFNGSPLVGGISRKFSVWLPRPCGVWLTPAVTHRQSYQPSVLLMYRVLVP